uniref:Uncharacterized protein n=1 Tax=Photinus pyralis TaxID=7054 RepID=A0A1Y1LNY0_PHOPY
MTQGWLMSEPDVSLCFPQPWNGSRWDIGRSARYTTAQGTRGLRKDGGWRKKLRAHEEMLRVGPGPGRKTDLTFDRSTDRRDWLMGTGTGPKNREEEQDVNRNTRNRNRDGNGDQLLYMRV